MHNIHIFKNKLLRQPLLPYNMFSEIPSRVDELQDFIKELSGVKSFSDAIFMASPELYTQWIKGVNEDSLTPKICYAILKYYIRSLNNTVPFGLFGSYAIADSHDSSQMRFSSLDMEYLSRVMAELNKNGLIRKAATYTLNNTLYRVGANFRYIEPENASGRLNYILSNLESDELLELLFSELPPYFTFDTACRLIEDSVDGFDSVAIAQYVNELIDSHIFSGGIQVASAGGNAIDQIIDFYRANYAVLSRDSYLSKIFDGLASIKAVLKNIDKKIFATPGDYDEVYRQADRIGIPYDPKYIINSNLRSPYTEGTDTDDKHIRQLLGVLLKIGQSPTNLSGNLERFKEGFYNRYEDEEVPILEVFDNELGLGYLSGLSAHSIYSELIDDISAPVTTAKTETIEIERPIYNFWMNLLLKGPDVIDLSHYDLSLFGKGDGNPGTFKIGYSVYGNKLCLKTTGGYSAATYLTRFGTYDSEVNRMVEEIVAQEKDIFREQLTAEIVHLPNFRAGNVLSRALDRGYEISILAGNTTENIALKDLSLSYRQGKIILRDVRQNKEVVPFLTSAQNYHYDSLPIFQFFCDLQSQYRNNYLPINFGGLAVDELDFMPRIIYGENIILRRATWILSRERIFPGANRAKAKTTGDLDILRNYIAAHSIPQYIQTVEGNEEKLLLDTQNEILLQILADEIRKVGIVKICETFIDVSQSGYANELHANIAVRNKVSSPFQAQSYTERSAIQRKFLLGDEWIYFKLYTGYVTADRILANELYDLKETLLEQGIVSSWFYIRYADPEFHLRLRFKISDKSKYSDLITLTNNCFSLLQRQKKLNKVETATYNRELERYNWEEIETAEEVFRIDSEFCVELLRMEQLSPLGGPTWLLMLKSIDDLLSAMSYSLEDKQSLLENMYMGFSAEFGKSKVIALEIDRKFRSFSGQISALFEGSLVDLDLYETRVKNLRLCLATASRENAWSFIHMHCNRIFKAKARFHELVLYGIMLKHYKGEIGKKKYQLNNEVCKTI